MTHYTRTNTKGATARAEQTDRETVEQLWRALAEHFLWYVENVPREKWTAKMLNTIRMFLRDNHCAASAAHQVSTRGQLSSLLSLGIPFGESGKDH
jgi:hypothetical protein